MNRDKIYLWTEFSKCFLEMSTIKNKLEIVKKRIFFVNDNYEVYRIEWI